MKNTFKISLKAHEKIYINGAVLRPDRKTSIEILNDVDFLLENHIMQLTEANTPVRQLYFIIQIMLMSPNDHCTAMSLYTDQMNGLLSSFKNERMLSELKDIDRLTHQKMFFEAMRSTRELFPLEAQIMAGSPQTDLSTVDNSVVQNRKVAM